MPLRLDLKESERVSDREEGEGHSTQWDQRQKRCGRKKRKKFPACRDGGEIQRQGRLHGAVWEAAGEERPLHEDVDLPPRAADRGSDPAAVQRAAPVLLHQPAQPHDCPLPPAQHPAVRSGGGLCAPVLAGDSSDFFRVCVYVCALSLTPLSLLSLSLSSISLCLNVYE